MHCRAREDYVFLCDSSSSRQSRIEIGCDSLGEAVQKSRQNRSQNRPKIAPGRRPGHPKSTKKRPRGTQGAPESSRECLGASPGCPGSVPRVPRGRPGVPRGFIRDPKRAPRRVPSRPGACKITPKSPPKAEKARNRRMAASECALGSIFSGFSVVFRKSRFPKIASTMGE